MGCVNSSSIVIVHSMESFRKESKKYLKQEKREGPDYKNFIFADEENDNTSHSSLDQSQIPIKAKIENNELIFL